MLKRLRENRQSGNTALQDYKVIQLTLVAEEAAIFDLVTEEEFNAISKRQIMEDDFVVDDNGEGYANRGLEDWDKPQSDFSDDEEQTEKGPVI